MSDKLAERAALLSTQGQRDSGQGNAPTETLEQRALRLQDMNRGATPTDVVIEKINVDRQAIEKPATPSTIDPKTAIASETSTTTSGPWMDAQDFASSIFNRNVTPMSPVGGPSPASQLNAPKPETVFSKLAYQQPEGLNPMGSGKGVGVRLEEVLMKGPFQDVVNRLVPQKGLLKEILQGIAMAGDLPTTGLIGGMKGVQETLAKSAASYNKGDYFTGAMYNVAAPVHGIFAGLMNLSGGGIMFQAGQKLVESAIPEAKPYIERGLAPFSTQVADWKRDGIPLLDVQGKEIPEAFEAVASLLDAGWGLIAFKKAHEMAKVKMESKVPEFLRTPVDPNLGYQTTGPFLGEKDFAARALDAKVEHAKSLIEQVQDETTSKPRQAPTDTPTGTDAPRRGGNVPLTGEERNAIIGKEMNMLAAARESMAKNVETPQGAQAIDSAIEVLRKDPENYARTRVGAIEKLIDSPTTSDTVRAELQSQLIEWRRFEIKEQPAVQQAQVPVADVLPSTAVAPSKVEVDPTVELERVKTEIAKVEAERAKPDPQQYSESGRPILSNRQIDELLGDTKLEELKKREAELERSVMDEDLPPVPESMEKGAPPAGKEGEIPRAELDELMGEISGPKSVKRARVKKEGKKAEPVAEEAPAQVEGEPAKSRGHIKFVGDREYFRTDKGQIWWAKISTKLNERNIRNGSWFANDTPEGRAKIDQVVQESQPAPVVPVTAEPQSPPTVAPTIAEAGAPKEVAPPASKPPAAKRGRKLKTEERLELATAPKGGTQDSGGPWQPYKVEGTSKLYTNEALAKKAAGALVRNKKGAIEARPVQSKDGWVVEIRAKEAAAAEPVIADHFADVATKGEEVQNLLNDVDDVFGIGKKSSQPKSGEHFYDPPQGEYDPRIFPAVRDKLQKLWSEFEKAGKTYEQFHDAVMERYDKQGIDTMRYLRESFPEKEKPVITEAVKAVIERQTAAAVKGMKDAGVDDATAATVQSGTKADGTPVRAADIDGAGQRIGRKRASEDDAVKRRDLIRQAQSSPERARLKDQLIDTKWGNNDQIEVALTLWDHHAVRWAEMVGESPEVWWKTRGVEARGLEKVGEQATPFMTRDVALEFRRQGEIVLTALKTPDANTFLTNSFQLFFGDMAMTLRDLNVKISTMAEGGEKTRMSQVKDQLIADIVTLEKATGLNQGEFHDLFRRIQADAGTTEQMVTRYRDAMQKMADMGERFLSGDEYLTKEIQPLLTRWREWAVSFWNAAKSKIRGTAITPAASEAMKRWFWNKEGVLSKPTLGQKATPRDYVGIRSDLIQWIKAEISPLVAKMRDGVGTPIPSDPQVLMQAVAEIFKSTRDSSAPRFTSLREAKEYVRTVKQRIHIQSMLVKRGISIVDEYAGLPEAEAIEARAVNDMMSSYMDKYRRKIYGIGGDTRSIPARVNVQMLLKQMETIPAERMLQKHISEIRNELESTLTKIADAEASQKKIKKEAEAAYKKASNDPNLTVTSPELTEAQTRRKITGEALATLRSQADELNNLYNFLAGEQRIVTEKVEIGGQREPLDAELIAELHKSPQSEGHIAFVGDKEFFYDPATKAIMKADITPEIEGGIRRKGVVHEKYSPEVVTGVRWMRTQHARLTEKPTTTVRTVENIPPADAQSFKDTFIEEIKLDEVALDIFGAKAAEMGWRDVKNLVGSVRSGISTEFKPWRSDAGAPITLPILEQGIELVQNMAKSDNQIHRALIRNFFTDLQEQRITDPVNMPIPDVKAMLAGEFTKNRYKTVDMEIAGKPVDQKALLDFRNNLKEDQSVYVVDPSTGKNHEAKVISVRVVGEGKEAKKFVTVDLGLSAGGEKEFAIAQVWDSAAQMETHTRTYRVKMSNEEIAAEDAANEARGIGQTNVEAGSHVRFMMRQTTPDPSPATPTSLMEIPVERVVNHIARTFNASINTKSKLFAWAKRVMGIYKEDPNSIWLREYGDLETLSHELGHFVEKEYFNNQLAQPNTLGPIMRQELARLDPDANQGRVTEGFAEYFRKLMTNRDVQSAAPNFDHFFRTQILSNHPKLLNAITSGRQKIWDYQSMSAVAKVGSLMDDIGGGKLSDGSWRHTGTFGEKLAANIEVAKVRTESLGSRVGASYRFGWSNSIDPIRLWVAEVTSMGLGTTITGASKDPYQVAMALNKTAPAVARAWVEDGIYNAQGELMCESLKDIIAQLPTKDVETLQAGLKLAYALRAEELMNRVDRNGQPAPVDVGLSYQDIQDVKALYNTPELKTFVDGLHRWNHATLEYLIDAGGLSRAEGEMIRDANLMYIPLKVAIDGHWDVHMGKWTGLGSKFKSGEGSSGRGFIDLGKPFHRIEGSKMGKVNPLEAMIIQAERLISMSNRARVSRAMVELAENVEGIAPWIEKVEPIKASSIRIEQMKGELQKAGLKVPNASLDKIVTIFSSADKYYGSENVINLIKDGKRQFYKIDPFLYNALTSMTTRQWAPIFNWLTPPARIVRLGTTGLNPAFNLLTNPLRDIQTAALQHSPMEGARSIAKAMAQISGDMLKEKSNEWFDTNLPRDPDVQLARILWKATGGEITQPLGGDRSYGEGTIHKMVDDALATGKIGNRIANFAHHPIEVARRMISFPESMPREAEFLRVMDKYRPEIANAENTGNMELKWRLQEDMMIEAANKAADVTVNFRRAGVYAEAINRIIPFFNPSIQGNTRMIRLAKENPKAFLMRAGSLMSASMALWAVNKDEDWYNELQGWERYGFWHFKIGEEIVRLPMPFEYGYIFSGITTAMMHDAYTGGDEEKKEVAKQIAKSMGPIDVSPITTDMFTGKTNILDAAVSQGIQVLGDVAAIRPMLESWKNKDIFRDRPLVPKELEDVQKWLQYTSNTPDMAKDIAQWGLWGQQGISPITFTHLANGYTGGLANYFLNMPTTLGIKKREVPWEPADTFVLGRLFVRHNVHGFGSKDVQKFYETFDKATGYKRTIDHMIAPRGDRPVKTEELVAAVKAGRLPEEAVWMYKAYPAFMDTRTFLQEARKRENSLRAYTAMDDDLKRKISKALAQAVMMKVKIANAGFEAYVKAQP